MRLLLDIEMDGLDEPLTFEQAKEFVYEMLNSAAVYVEISNPEEKMKEMADLIKYLYIYRSWGMSMKKQVEDLLGEEVNKYGDDE